MVAEGKIPPAGTAASFGTGRIDPDAATDGSSADDVGKNVRAAYEAALTYLSAQADRVRLAVRNIVIAAALGIVAGVFLIGMLITAGVLLLNGVAGAISRLLNLPLWAGELITGSLIVGAVVIAAVVVVSRMLKAARVRTMLNYQKPRDQK